MLPDSYHLCRRLWSVYWQLLYGDPNVGNVTTYTVLALNPVENTVSMFRLKMAAKAVFLQCYLYQPRSWFIPSSRNHQQLQSLIEGIKDSYSGEVLGESTELMVLLK